MISVRYSTALKHCLHMALAALLMAVLLYTITFWEISQVAGAFEASSKDTVSQARSTVSNLSITRGKLSWAIFTPSPTAVSASHSVALRSWLNLRIPPKVYLVVHDDRDAAGTSMVDQELGTKTLTIKSDVEGVPQSEAIFELASREQDVDVVVVLNSDIVLGDDFVDAIEFTHAEFDRFLLTGAPYSSPEVADIPRDADLSWASQYRKRAFENGDLYTSGGPAYFAWRPENGPVSAAISGLLPGFSPDWVTKLALKNDRLEVVDASTAVIAIAPERKSPVPATEDSSVPSDDAQRSPSTASSSKLQRHRLLTGDLRSPSSTGYVDYNSSEGEPINVPWTMMRCKRPKDGSEYPCVRQGVRPLISPLEHGGFVPATVTKSPLEGNVGGGEQRFVCGTDGFSEEYAFLMLIKQRAEGGKVILLGFNNGYQDMLSNMLCQLQRLDVNNYVIAAFEEQAMAFCKGHMLPCFAAYHHEESESGPASAEAGAKEKPAAPALPTLDPSAVDFGTAGFTNLTKAKSQQVLRILRLGYDVVWSDVDIFWKVNPIEGMLEEMGSADIGIQSDVPASDPQDVGSGRPNLNSGFYYARSSNVTVRAFEEITKHAMRSTLSEQPSFADILCGGKREYVVKQNQCLNTKIAVKTHVLSRQIYPNGAMTNVTKNVTPTSVDKVAIVHFNWVKGHGAKVKRFVKATMWVLDEHGQCLQSPRASSRDLAVQDESPAPAS